MITMCAMSSMTCRLQPEGEPRPWHSVALGCVSLVMHTIRDVWQCYECSSDCACSLCLQASGASKEMTHSRKSSMEARPLKMLLRQRGPARESRVKRRCVKTPTLLNPTYTHLHHTQVVVDDEHETPASWTSVAAGLAHLSHGIAGAVSQEQCTSQEAQRVFSDADELLLLLEACPNNDAR